MVTLHLELGANLGGSADRMAYGVMAKSVRVLVAGASMLHIHASQRKRIPDQSVVWW